MTYPNWATVSLAFVTALATGAVFASGPLSEAIFGHGDDHLSKEPLPVNAVAGFTKVGFTTDYVVIVNVLPGERMFSVEEVARDRPQVGEMSSNGDGNEVLDDSRHVEAHIYDRHTGLPVIKPVPTIEVFDAQLGKTTVVRSVAMQDVITGASDSHFGDNIVIGGGTDLTVRVKMGSQEVVVDGRLD